MNILLCDIPITSDAKFGSFRRVGSSFPPYNLLILGTILKNLGHSVCVTTDQFTLVDVARVVREFKPDLVGVTFMTLGAPSLQAFCSMMDATAPEVPLIAGGYHSSLYAADILRGHPRLLAVFKGEAERSLPLFVTLLRSSQWPSASELRDIPGIAFLDGEILVETSPAPRIEDLDELPFPEYDLIPGYFKKSSAAVNRHYFRRPQAFFLTGRGCPYECHFCGRMLLGRTVRQNSIDYTIEHIRFVRDRYGIRSIVYADEFLTQHKKNMTAFSDKLQKTGLDNIRWACSGRINNTDRNFAKILHAGGCRQIGFGLESGSQKILNLLNKKAEVEQMAAAVRGAAEGGLEVFGNFMIGCPGETRQTLDETRRFILDNPLGFIVICYFTPMPGSFYWDQQEYKKYGTLVSTDFSIFNTFAGIPFVPHGFTAADLIEFRRRIYRDFYLRPQRLVRELRHLANPSTWAFAGRLAGGMVYDAVESALGRRCDLD